MPIQPFGHPALSRRTAIQAGAVGLLGLGGNHLSALREASAASPAGTASPRSVIYIFLSGGLAQHDSFDMKPMAPASKFQRRDCSAPGGARRAIVGR